MAKKEKSLMRQLIDERGIKDVAGVQALVKELTAGLIQECMDAELEDDLGYSKYDYRNKETDNSRNGTYKKTVSSSQGDIELEVPRDRNGEYEPQIVKKHQMDISAIEDKIIFLYSQGTSTRDIEKAMATNSYSRLPSPSAAAVSTVWMALRVSMRSINAALPASGEA